MVFWLYNLLLVVLMPVWVPAMLLRSRKRKVAPNFRERFGQLEIVMERGGPRIWIHAVSVGEVIAAVPMLAALRQMGPESQVVLSVTTSSGHETATKLALSKGLINHLVYFPVDLPYATLSALGRVRPDCVAIMETELWMNFLWAAQTVRAKTLVVNGRISDRSFRKSKNWAFFYRALYRYLDLAAMQTQKDVDRANQLGCSNAQVYGNTKIDEAIMSAEADRGQWRRELGVKDDEVLIVVGSTRGFEECKFVVDALAELPRANWKVVHAPRHLEDADALVEYAREKLGSVARRSLGESGDYLVLDTYGELASVYVAGDVAIIGGGFGAFGGQNLIQAMAAHLPILHGPNFENFQEAVQLATEAQCNRVVKTEEELAIAVQELLDDEALRRGMGERAWKAIAPEQGASRRYAELILESAREVAAQRSK